jgi:hypothetical protein
MKYLPIQVITFIFHPELFTTYYIKYSIILKYLVSKPIQPDIEKKDSILRKEFSEKIAQSFNPGKFLNVKNS